MYKIIIIWWTGHQIWPQMSLNWDKIDPKWPPNDPQKSTLGPPQGPQGTPVPSSFPPGPPEASKHSNSHTDWDPPRAPRGALINTFTPWTPRYHPPVFTSNYTTLAPYSQAPLLEHFPSGLPRTPRPCGVGGFQWPAAPAADPERISNNLDSKRSGCHA